MKKLSRNLAFLLLITSMILPILPVIIVAQDDEPIVYRIAASALPGDWDPAITDAYNVIYGSYFFSACEYDCGGNADFYGGVYKPLVDEWKPIIATSWTMENWPSENNSLGFYNSGGNKAMTLTLREGVKFHDGSDWNATVFKWNIDRMYLITGNLTGNGDTRNQVTFWDEIDPWEPYFTESWNFSALNAPDATIEPIWVPPDVTKYAGYYIGNEATYPGVTAVDGWVYNPNPYGGWDPIALNFINYAPYDKYPLIRYVEIIDNATSGGTVKVHYNSWNSYGMEGALYTPKISYQAYHKNYTGRGIYGYENGVKDAKNPTIVDHMIGTGPYIYVEHDQTASPAGGYMIKNENYWNKTALEAEGWFDVDIREVVNFPTGEFGRDAQNTALLTHAIDYCYDSMYMPVDYKAVMKNKNIDYIEDDPSNFKTQITLNCINESWWISMEGWRTNTGPTEYPSDKEPAGGIPRALREAMTHAFDYDLMIDTVLDGRAVRGGGVVSIASIYYNASVPLPGYDLAEARNILLTTETDAHTLTYTQDIYNFSKLCADRSLTASSTDAQWENIAVHDPIFTLDFYWDSAHEDFKSVLQSSLKKIGVALKDKTGATNRVPTIIWDTVRTYWEQTFDGSHSIWSANAWVMDYDMPETIPEGWIDANYGGEYGLDYWPAWNFGFCYDTEIDYWIDRMYMSSPDEKIGWISKISDKEQNEIFPMVYAYQAKGGFCLWKDWDTFWVKGRYINRTGYWGTISTHFLSYVGLPSEYPLIPGAPLLITITVSGVSMIGIIYAMMRKKKL